MGTISKEILSGSLQGKPIQITATGSTGTTIHTTLASSTIIDEVWLYATNSYASDVELTIEYGATGSPYEISADIPTKSGLSLILAGTILTGDGSTGSTITSYAASPNSVNLIGYVNRITP